MLGADCDAIRLISTGNPGQVSWLPRSRHPGRPPLPEAKIPAFLIPGKFGKFGKFAPAFPGFAVPARLVSPGRLA